MTRVLSYAQAINEALAYSLRKDPRTLCFGLGTDDPKGVFGTTVGLQEEFGEERVFDMPTSENGMTGVAIGAALDGARPIMTHQRLDFFLLAMDQLVNNAAKWHYMFGGASSVPITIRLILGRGWGQGPTHSQNLQSWFSHIPGLKVVAPAFPADAKSMLVESIFDNNPVVFLEHRWCHNVEGEVPSEMCGTPLGKANVLKEGDDITIVSYSYMTIEALHAVSILKDHGINADLIDLRSLIPLDWEAIQASIERTGRLLVLDTSHRMCSYAGEIIARASESCFDDLRGAPCRITLPDVPSPTSPALTKSYYPGAREICEAALRMVGSNTEISPALFERGCPHDVPGDWFKGPF